MVKVVPKEAIHSTKHTINRSSPISTYMLSLIRLLTIHESTSRELIAKKFMV